MTPVPPPRVSLSIVIPAFNEANRIGPSLDRIVEFLSRQPWHWEIRVVDDGSTDDTCSIVENAARRDSRVILQREPHRGKGGAAKAGLLAAKTDVRFLCDADLSMPPEEISKFMPPALAEFDIAIGSREGIGARRVGEPWRRHMVGRFFNYAIRWLVLPTLADTQCGFKMFTAKSVERVFPLVTLDGWAFDVEVLSLARSLDLRVVEVPIEWHYQAQSRLRILSDGLRMLRDVFKIRASVGARRRG